MRFFREMRRLGAGFGFAIAASCFWGSASAAPADCMATSPDGTAKCTLPVISERKYNVCIANNLSTTESASAYCSGTVGPIKDDGSIVNFVNCVGKRLTQNPPVMKAINWFPDGTADASREWLCGKYGVIWRYGVEMHGFEKQSLYYDVFSRRDRTAECPRGYSAVGANSEYPDYCVKAAAQSCNTVGNPLNVATAEKKLFETDYAPRGASPLEFRRSYSSVGYYRPLASASTATPGFGDFWRHTYDRRVFAEGSVHLMATALRHDGTEKHFRSDGKDLLNQDGGRDTLAPINISGSFAGWLYRQSDGTLETYDTSGKLLSIQDAGGRKQTLVYSDASTPPEVAPGPGLLLRVSDDFGRSLQFRYLQSGQMDRLQTPDGGAFYYRFDSRQMLTSVTNPDSTTRSYVYNELGSGEAFASAGGPWAISGIYDESGARYATYRYRDGYWNTPDSTEHGNGVEKYVRMPAGDGVSITDPLGSTRTYSYGVVNGASRLISQSQPAGSGCNASSNVLAYDTRGNVASADDFDGYRSCHVHDGRNFESLSVYGLPNSVACSSVTAAGASLPAGSRKLSSQWHPDWHLLTKQAEPGKFTTWVYNGQPDPFNGNAIASCAPSTAVLSDGKPIAVVCKQVEQATNDADGASGFSTANLPAVTGDPSFANVTLLLHMDGGSAAFLDSSPNPKTATVAGAAQMSTSVQKFGGASLSLNGAGSYLSYVNSSEFSFGTGDFTVETWFQTNVTPVSGGQQVIASNYAGPAAGWTLQIYGSTLIFCVMGDGVDIQSAAGSVVANTWYHVAVTRQGSTLRLFINGTLAATTTNSESVTSSVPLLIGRLSSSYPSVDWNGYIDDLRITKGVARYTATFTPPAAAFPNTQTTLPPRAMIDSSTTSRVWRYTYNQYGQVLTATSPRTDLTETTTFAYYSDTTVDHTTGDLKSVTNPLGKLTQYTKYNPLGQVLQMVDPNGGIVDTTYDNRQRLKTMSIGGRTTSFDYHPTGKLKRVTAPSATSYVEYSYDTAQRLIAIVDNLGNRIDYTLDNAGNKTAEKVNDPSGSLVRQHTRALDALSRVQQITGRE